MSASASISGRPLAALRVAHLITGVLLTLGILGALRTGLDETDNVIVFETSPGLALAWLALGLIGGGMAHDVAGSVRYLAVVGPVALVLAAGGLIGGAGVLTGDTEVLALHAAIAVMALGAVALMGGPGALLRRPSPPSADAPE